jgi:hypothetical protein
LWKVALDKKIDLLFHLRFACSATTRTPV